MTGAHEEEAESGVRLLVLQALDGEAAHGVRVQLAPLALVGQSAVALVFGLMIALLRSLLA